MPEPCHYCGQPVRLSKDNYRTKNLKANGAWVRLIWHTKCDPYTVNVNVSQKPRP